MKDTRSKSQNQPCDETCDDGEIIKCVTHAVNATSTSKVVIMKMVMLSI